MFITAVFVLFLINYFFYFQQVYTLFCEEGALKYLVLDNGKVLWNQTRTQSLFKCFLG